MTLKEKLRKDWAEIKNPSRSSPSDLGAEYPRATGAVIAAVSRYFIYACLISPFIDSSHGVEQIRISVKAVVASIVFFVAGAGLCLFGPSKLKMDEKKLTKGWVIFILVLMIVAFGAYVCLELTLDSRGYIKQ